jgi:dynein heavy chain 2, cytosolic
LAKESDDTRTTTEQLINEYFYQAYQWIVKENAFVVQTTLIGTVLNGLSHLHGVNDKSLFALGLIRGLGGNLNEKAKDAFAREVRVRSFDETVDMNLVSHCRDKTRSFVRSRSFD